MSWCWDFLTSAAGWLSYPRGLLVLLYNSDRGMEAVSRASGDPRHCNERHWAALTLGKQPPPPRPPAVAQLGPLLIAPTPHPCMLTKPEPTAPRSSVAAVQQCRRSLWLLQTQVLWPRLPAAQQHLGGSCFRATPLHTSVMAPLGAVWENDFNPTRQKQISYISSVHTDRAEVKCLLFFCWTANAVDTDLPFKWERLYYQPLAAIPSWGQAPAPCLSPKH